MSRDLLAFFSSSLIQPIWFPDKQSKMVLLKNSFSWRYSQTTWLWAVWYCLESDSAHCAQYHTAQCAELDSVQYHTAQSREIQMSENPKKSHTARSVILRRVKQFYLISKTSISRTFRVYKMIFRKCFENISKIENG